MSLPREWSTPNSRGSLQGTSESYPTGRVQHQSGGFILSSTEERVGECGVYITDKHNHQLYATDIPPSPPPSLIGHSCEIPTTVSCSQPAPPSLLTECQQSTGSLFSVVSAPPVPLAELDVVKQVDALNSAGLAKVIGITPGLGLQAGIGLGLSTLGGSAHNAFSTTSMDAATAATILAAGGAIGCTMDGTATIAGTTTHGIQRRPATLPINAPYCPAPTSRTLHASLLEHQITEIDEDDNENLLTVSSITARPLIAKSREICSNRQLQLIEQSAKRVGKQARRANASIRAADGKVADTDQCIAGKRTTSASSRSSVNADPPDGGYGWFIVFGAFSVQFWVAGLVKSYGVLYVEIMETFPSSTATVASWIPAILSALCLVLAPVSSALCQRFSCRSVVFVGGLFCALGLTLSYFATSLLHLLITFGVLTGIGGGLSTTPGIVIVSQYFDKHRALANGICVSGTAAGSFILPVLIKHLAENFGFHGTILILGGCMFHVCISATLYRPIEDYNSEHSKLNEEEEESAKPLNDINISTTGMLTGSTYLDTCDGTLNNKFIEHLFMEESKNRLNDLYSGKETPTEKQQAAAQENDDEIKDVIGETTFIKPMKKVRSSGIMHSVEDLSTDSTWMYRKNSGTDSNRGSRRRRNVFANDEIISKIQAHLEKPLSPPVVVTRGLSKSMEIPTPVSNFTDFNRRAELHDLNGAIVAQQPIGIRMSDEDDENDDNEAPRTCCERIEMYLDISLLKDTTFILMCLSVTLMSVGCPYMLYYLPAHVISIGNNKSQAGYLVAVSAALDLCGRLGLGWLSDLQLFDRKKTYIFCILGAGIAVLTIPSAHSLALLGLSAAVYGFCLGSWYVLMPVLLADIFGTDRISSSYGLVRMFQSIGAISVPPLAGFLRDLSGSYDICFYCMGTCMVLGSIPLLVSALLESREGDPFEQPDESDENSTVS
ncbi:monocarboxylate transporter 14 [Eurosta solidaginis]|uniref:monocarboxylate transporter 14 n=1 Tax=Eurosta solidaginis TaxID=178769 RepID=UPI003530B8D4